MALASCFVIPDEPEKIDFPQIRTGEVNYHVTEVKRQDLVNSVTVYGSFQPALREGLYFKYTGGRLLDLFVEEEDRVVQGQVLATLNVTGLDNQIKLQEIALEKARTRLEMLAVTGSNRYEYRMAELDVASAEVRLEESRGELGNNRIVAPFGGVITYIAADVGDFVQPFDPIISLENMDKLVLECDPRSTQHLREGMGVQVEVDDETYPGTVVRAYRDIIALGLEALDEEKAIIDVPGIPADTKRGEPGRVTVVLDEARDTIVVQKSYVKEFGDRSFVYVLRDGVKVEQDVVLGLETRSRVEIVEGLSEGDQLIIK
jgi:macrolide-specific efflux system membrane fusion protein